MRIKSTLLEMTTETKVQKSQEERLKLKGVGVFTSVWRAHTSMSSNSEMLGAKKDLWKL